MADDTIDELRLTFETALLKTDNEQRERLLEHLGPGGQGQSKFAQFHLICQSIEQNIGSVHNPQRYLNDLIAVITLDLPAIEGDIDFYLGGAPETAEVDDILASIRQTTSDEIQSLQKQLDMLNGQLRRPRSIPVSDHFATPEQPAIFRRDFKIAGQVGEPGQADKLNYIGLIHQIDADLKRGYDESEIVEAKLRDRWVNLARKTN